MANYYRKFWLRSYRLLIEELEPRNAPGSILSHPALALIFLFGFEIGELSRDLTPAWNTIPDAASVQWVNMPSEASNALGGGALDGYFSQLDGSQVSASGGVSTVSTPQDEATGSAATASHSLLAMLGNVAVSESIDRALAAPLSIEHAPAPSGGGTGTATAQNPPSASAAGTSAAPTAGSGGAGAGVSAGSTGAPPAAPASSASSNNWQLLIPAMQLSTITSSQVAASANNSPARGPPTRYGVSVAPNFGGQPADPQLVPLAGSQGHRAPGYSLGSPPAGHGHGHGHGKGGAGNASNPDPLDPAIITDEDTPVNVYWLTYGDIDPNGYGLSVQSVEQPSHGSAVLNADGTVTYSPALHYSGTDSFDYTITNGQGGTANATAMITVNPVHYPPTVNNVNVSTNENAPVTVTLSGSSIEGLPLTYEVDTGPGNGTLSAVNGNAVTYYPGGNFSGTDTFTYDASDGDVSSIASGTVIITVNSVTLNPGVTITPAGGGLQITEQGGVMIAGADTSDQSGTFTVVLNTQPAADVTVAVNAPSELAVDQPTLTFTSSNWSMPQTVTVTAPDDSIAEPDHTVSITHSASSADPTYNGMTITSVPVALTDSDFAGIFADPGDDPVTLNEVGPTSTDFPISLDSQPAANVTVTLAPDSYETVSPTSLTFTPSDWDTPQSVTVTAVNTGTVLGYHTGTITMTAASADPTYSGLSDSFSVNILDANGPNALPVTAETDENASTTFDVLSNDSDPNGYTLTVSGLTQPANGTVVNNGDGTLTYTPNPDWSGDDSFSYTISNGQGGSATGSITATADPVDLPPVVTDPGDQSNETDTAISLQITATAASANSSTAFVYSASNLPPGLVIDPMTGTIWGWIDPEAGDNSYDTTVTVDDQDGGVTSVTFIWNVSVRDHGPVLYTMWDGVMYVGQGGPEGGPGAYDIDGYAVTFTVSGLPPGFSYDPTTNAITGTATTAGTYTVTVAASDGHGGTDQEMATWYVLAADDAVPYAYIDLGDGGLDQFLTVSPPTPHTARVYLLNPSNPGAQYAVTLAVPSGSSTLSQTEFTLSDGQYAEFQISPTAVSQKLNDVVITATVDGRETDREGTTNFAIVLPQTDPKGKDTPDGMRDRVSTGKGNWGTYYGVFQVYPNLMGFNILSLGVQSADGNPDDGAAAVDDTTYMDENNSVAAVYGTAATQPKLDGAGDVVGDPNDWKLQLLAQFRNVGYKLIGNALFSTFDIPTAVEMSYMSSYAGAKIPATQGNDVISTDDRWHWGVVYKVTFLSDGGGLGKDIWAREEINRQSPGTAGFRDVGDEVTTWQKAIPEPPITTWSDVIGPTYRGTLDIAKARLDMAERGVMGGSLTLVQDWRWQRGPKNPLGALGNAIPISGFLIHAQYSSLRFSSPLNLPDLVIARVSAPAGLADFGGILLNVPGHPEPHYIGPLIP